MPFGSIGSWLLSLLFGGSFLGSPYIIVIYALMAALIIGIDAKGMPAILEEDEPADAFHFSQAILPLAGIVVVLLSITKGLGFYFPVSDQISGTGQCPVHQSVLCFRLDLSWIYQ
jgi:hypothetical protein